MKHIPRSAISENTLRTFEDLANGSWNFSIMACPHQSIPFSDICVAIVFPMMEWTHSRFLRKFLNYSMFQGFSWYLFYSTILMRNNVQMYIYILEKKILLMGGGVFCLKPVPDMHTKKNA